MGKGRSATAGGPGNFADELAVAWGGSSANQSSRVSPELVEILVAYGPAPVMPRFDGDLNAYAHAVRLFERLSATPDAARIDALSRYFDDRRAQMRHVLDQAAE